MGDTKIYLYPGQELNKPQIQLRQGKGSKQVLLFVW